MEHCLFFVAPSTAQTFLIFSKFSCSAFLCWLRFICDGDADDIDDGIENEDTATGDDDGGDGGVIDDAGDGGGAGIVDVPLDAAELFRDCGCLRLEPQYEELL